MAAFELSEWKRLVPPVIRREILGLKMAARYHCRKRRHEPFAFVLTCPRTGSNLLINYLNPEAKCGDYEALTAKQPYGLRQKWVEKKIVFGHIRHFIDFYGPMAVPKIFFHELKIRRVTLQEMVSEFPAVRWLILYRKNILDQHLSFQLAGETGVWFKSRYSAHRQNLTRIALDPKAALYYRDEVRKNYSEALNLPPLKNRSLWISYEEITSDDANSLFQHTVFPFLGLPARPLKSNLLKLNTRTYDQILSNYSDVKNFIAQTDFSQSYPLHGTSSIRQFVKDRQ